jgi:hypothetical protein
MLELYHQGQVLVWSGDVPGSPGIRQTIGVEPSSEQARVSIEHYYPTEWDRSIEERELHFPDLDSALSWLELNCGVHWTELHLPGSAPPGTPGSSEPIKDPK